MLSGIAVQVMRCEHLGGLELLGGSLGQVQQVML
jgi:hypothetical protein